MPQLKRPPSKTWECCPCRNTFFSKTAGNCPDCGAPLTIRPDGAEPYGRPLEDSDLAVTSDDDVILVKTQ